MTAVLAVSVAVALVLATHATTAFQLDGDATQATGGHVAPPPGGLGADDWNEICYEEAVDPNGDGDLTDGISAADAQTLCGASTAADGGSAGTVVSSAWTAEPSPDSTTIFTEGSKDILDISGWTYKNTGGLPDKDNLLHGFGARYSLPPDPDDPGSQDSACPAGTFSTCEVLYFGSDRYDDEGSATTGVWFFQKKVTLGPLKQGSGPFIGVHTVGDVLVTSEFTIGGTISTMKIFTWQPHCTGNHSSDGGLPPDQAEADCAEKNLYLEASSTAANCASATAADAFCGLVNNNEITLPWGGTAAFQDKDKTGGVGSKKAAAGEFYEGGINLSQLGLADECFSSVLLNSRSSAEPNSTIKDFVLGQLGDCSTSLTTQASLNSAGADISNADDATNGKVSSGTDSATVTVKGISTWAGSVEFFLCGPLASASVLCDASGYPVNTGATAKSVSNGSASATSDSVTLTSAGRYCWFAKFTPDQATADKGVTGAEHAGTAGAGNLECFTVRPTTPTLTTTAGAGGATPVAFGDAVTDTARLSGLSRAPGSGGANTTYPTIAATNAGAFVGTITFVLKTQVASPPAPPASQCGATATPLANTTPTGMGPTNVTGPDVVYGPASFKPDAPGPYHWQATFTNGTNPNVNIAAGASVTHNSNCREALEAVTVQQIPTLISTGPFTYPQDTASIKAQTGNLPSGGTIVFKLFGATAGQTAAQNCTTNGATGLVYGPESKDGPTNTTTALHTVSTNNTTFKVDSSKNGTYVWRVTYTPGGLTHTGATSSCVESSVITHTDHNFPANP